MTRKELMGYEKIRRAMAANAAKARFELVGKWEPCEAYPDGYSGKMGISGTLAGLRKEADEIRRASDPCDVNLLSFPDSMWIDDPESIRGEIYDA